MKRIAKTIAATSLITLLAACGGGGSEAQPASKVVNPTKVEVEEVVRQQIEPQAKPEVPSAARDWLASIPTTKMAVDTTKKPSVYEIGAAYRGLMNLVSDTSDRQPTSEEFEMIAKLESWYWVRFGMLAQSGEKFNAKENLNRVEKEMNVLKTNFSYRNYVGRIMSAVYPAMLVKPETWEEAVVDYFKSADRMLGRDVVKEPRRAIPDPEVDARPVIEN